MKKLFFITLLMISFSNLFFAQDDVQIYHATHFGGIPGCVASAGDNVYLCQGTFLKVFDNSGNEFEKIAELNFGKYYQDMMIRDNRAFLIGGDFSILDISNPESPQILSALELELGFKSQIWIEGDYAYISTYNNGFYIVDISDLSNPVLIAQYAGDFYDIAVSGDYAYLIRKSDEKILVLDINDKSNPVEITNLEFSKPQSIFIVGNYAYVTNTSYPNMGLYIVDISKPDEPKIKSLFKTLTQTNNLTHYHIPKIVSVKDNIAYVACEGETSVFTIDVSNPSNPEKKGFLKISESGNPVSLSIQNNSMFIAMKFTDKTFFEIDISDLTDLKIIQALKSPKRIRWTYSDSVYLFVADNLGIWLYDMQDPADPQFLKLYTEWDESNEIIRVENRLYVFTWQDIRILDISDPMNIVELGVYVPSFSYGEEAVDGDYIYGVTWQIPGKLEIINVSDPANCIKSGEITLPGLGRAIYLDEKSKRLYVSYWKSETETGTLIFDIKNPQSPVLLKTITSDKIPMCIVAKGDTLFIGSINEVEADTAFWYLEVFDISDTANIVKISENSGEGQIWSLHIKNDYLIAGIYGGSVYIFNMYVNDKGELIIEAICHSKKTNQTSVTTDSKGDGYVTDVQGDGYADSSGHKYNDGGGGVVIQIIKIPPGNKCCYSVAVKPEQASIDGCTINNPCGIGGCGKENLIKALPQEDWVFEEWGGVMSGRKNPEKISYSGKVPPGCSGNCKDWRGIAYFTPWLKLEGGGDVLICPPSEEEDVTATSFNLSASKADDWTITSIDVNLNGSQDIIKAIKKATLIWQGKKIEVEVHGASVIHFDVNSLTISKGETVEFSFILSIDKMEKQCPFEPQKLQITIDNSNISAEPLLYLPGEVLDDMMSEITCACIYNDDKNTTYEHIQEAIDDANDDNTISVCPGDYEENIIINKQLTIQSTAGPNETYILGVNEPNHIVNIEKNNVKIIGFTIKESSFVSNKINYRSDDSGNDNKFQSSNTIGILVNGENASIKNCIVLNNETGIKIENTKKIIIDNSKIYQNKKNGVLINNSNEIKITSTGIWDNMENGIVFYDCKNKNDKKSQISDSYFNKNKKSGVVISNSENINFNNIRQLSENEYYGYLLENCAHISIENTDKIKKNKLDGIKISNSDSIQIVQNKLENNTSGIYVEKSKNIEIEQNKLYRDKDNAIVINECENAGISIISNEIDGVDHTGYGVYLIKSSKITIGEEKKGNIIKRNKIAGVFVEESDSNHISYNDISGIKKGIHVKKSCNNEINDNKTNTNTIGIDMESCDCDEQNYNKLIKNHVEDNYENGIYVSQSFGMNIEENEVLKNHENGISLFACESSFYKEPVYIKKNNVKENDIDGIRFYHSSANYISDNNIIEGNKENGITLLAISYFNKITENIIKGSNNKENGIYINNSQGNYIDNNEIQSFDKGVYVYNCNAKEEKNIRIVNNKLTDNNEGIYVENSKHISIGFEKNYDNDIKGKNEIVDGKKSGICIYNCNEDIRVSYNYIKNCVKAILIEKNLNTVVSKNFTTKNEYGIYILNSEQIFLGKQTDDRNYVFENTEAGICIKDSKDISVKGNNDIYKNKIGLIIDNSKECIFDYQNVFKNIEYGFSLLNSEKITINKSIINENKKDGIYLKWSENNEITENEITKNGGSGIYLYESERNRIGIEKKPNKLLENKDHGLRLDAAHYNIIEDNEIMYNEKHGMVFNHCRRNFISGEIYIFNNKKDGIQLNGSVSNIFWGRYIKYLSPSGKKRFKYGIRIKNNGGIGIHFKYASKNSFSNIKIWYHSTGMFLEHSNRNKFSTNIVIGICGIGSEEICSYHNNFGVCVYYYCGSATKVVGCSVVPSYRTKNQYKDTESDAVVTSKGGKPTFYRNNFVNTKGYVIRNLNNETIIDARYNWWGDPSGPGGAGPGNGGKITENVLYSPWLLKPVDMTVLCDRDTVYVPKGVSTNTYCSFNNLIFEGDSVNVVVQDQEGWNNYNFDMKLPDSLALDTTININVPVGNNIAPQNKYYISATSYNNVEYTDIDSFLVIVYESKLEDIIVSPENVVLQKGEKIQFVATGFDAHGQEVIMNNVNWSATAGDITEEGMFTATEAGNITVVATNDNGDISGVATVYITPESKLTDIEILPYDDAICLGQSLDFRAKGIDQYGKQMSVFPVWYCDKDSIDYTGRFTPLDTGIYMIIVYDIDEQFYDTAYVLVREKCVLNKIEIQPGEITIATGQKYHFEAIGYNQYNERAITGISWQTTGGLIDDTGTFSSATAGDYLLIAIDSTAQLQDTASIHVIDGIALQNDTLYLNCSMDTFVELLNNDAGYGLTIEELLNNSGNNVFNTGNSVWFKYETNENMEFDYVAVDLQGLKDTAHVVVNVEVPEEIWYDGKDGNCDGKDDFDQDEDGYIPCDYGSIYTGDLPVGDCDDTDAGVYDGAEEICDGKDNNCDGLIDNLSCDGLSVMVSNGFSYITGKDTLTLIPKSLASCDNVFWIIEGIQDTIYSTGNNPVKVFNNNFNNIKVCMYVTRFDTEESTCTENYCTEITGNKEILMNNRLKVFPNPAEDMIYVQLPQEAAVSNNKLEIYDYLGKKIFDYNVGKNEKIIKIDISGLQENIYFIVLKSSDYILQYSKFVKMQ